MSGLKPFDTDHSAILEDDPRAIFAALIGGDAHSAPKGTAAHAESEAQCRARGTAAIGPHILGGGGRRAGILAVRAAHRELRLFPCKAHLDTACADALLYHRGVGVERRLMPFDA